MRSPNPLSSVKSVKLTGTVILTDLSSAMFCAIPLTLILSIVLGHSQLFHLEVSWYQIPIFFLVAGYLFKEESVDDYQTYFII